MSLFEYFNCQILLDDLISIKELNLEDFSLKIQDLTIVELEEELKKRELDINKLYIKKDDMRMIYIDKYVATEVAFLSRELLDDMFLGVQIIKERNEAFKEMFFNKNEIYLVFSSEFNRMALHTFLALYKEIPTDIVYSVFVSLYQDISFGFSKMPPEVIEYVFLFKPQENNIIERIKSELKERNIKVDNNLNKNSVIKIYRGQGDKSLGITKAKFSSWTLSKDIAENFANFNKGKVLESKIKVSDILEFLEAELEVWCEYEKIKQNLIEA